MLKKDDTFNEVSFKDVIDKSSSICIKYSMDMSCMVYQTLINKERIAYLCVCPACHKILDRCDDFSQEDMSEFDYQIEMQCNHCGSIFTQENMNLIKLGRVLKEK